MVRFCLYELVVWMKESEYLSAFGYVTTMNWVALIYYHV